VPLTFSLHPGIDAEAHRCAFAATGHVQIMPFLAEADAQALREQLRARDDWREVLNSGERVFELDRATQKSMPADKRAELDRAVLAGAQRGFQYRYETLRVPDARAERNPDDPLHRFAEFLSSAPALELLREVTGCRDIDFADCQGTGYRPGDFLTAHDDAVEGKNRRAAYVFGLTPGWQTEWGGLLMFHDGNGDVSRALLPRFNCLNIFSVPQLHSVSFVAPYAARLRLSVTGWLRALGQAR
jgi:SM-20-related protein